MQNQQLRCQQACFFENKSLLLGASVRRSFKKRSIARKEESTRTENEAESIRKPRSMRPKNGNCLFASQKLPSRFAKAAFPNCGSCLPEVRKGSSRSAKRQLPENRGYVQTKQQAIKAKGEG